MQQITKIERVQKEIKIYNNDNNNCTKDNYDKFILISI